jgi:hypothetical protein
MPESPPPPSPWGTWRHPNWALVMYWVSRIGAVLALLLAAVSVALYAAKSAWIPWAQATLVLLQVALVAKAILRHQLRQREGPGAWQAPAPPR